MTDYDCVRGGDWEVSLAVGANEPRESTRKFNYWTLQIE